MTWFRCLGGGGGSQPFPYTESKSQSGNTPIEFSLPSTNGKTTHVTVSGTVYAPSALVGFEATVGTISNNNLNVTETSAYHWSYVQTFDITCDVADGRIIYNGALNLGSIVTASVSYMVQAG